MEVAIFYVAFFTAVLAVHVIVDAVLVCQVSLHVELFEVEATVEWTR